MKALDILARDLRPLVIEAGWEAAGSCIVSCRIVHEVLRDLHVRHRVMHASVFVFNDAAYALVQEGVPVEEWPPEAHSIGVDTRPENFETPDDAGHVVVVGEGWLLDPSFDQFHRPEKGIEAEPFYGPLPKSWKEGGEFVTYAHDGFVAMYIAEPKVRRYSESPNWGRRDQKHRRPIVRELVRTIREEGI